MFVEIKPTLTGQGFQRIEKVVFNWRANDTFRISSLLCQWTLLHEDTQLMHDIVEENFQVVLVRVFRPRVWFRGFPGIFRLLRRLVKNSGKSHVDKNIRLLSP